MEDFQNKVVLITGAAGGLGQATALAFASAGAKLSLADVNGDGLQHTVDKIAALGCEAPLRTIVDLGTRASCVQRVKDTASTGGGLDILCNVAAILGPSRIENVTEELWQKVLAVNLSAPFWLCQAAIPLLLERGGNIVNVA